MHTLQIHCIAKRKRINKNPKNESQKDKPAAHIKE